MSRTINFEIIPSCARPAFASENVACPDGRIVIGGREGDMINYKASNGDPFFMAAAAQYAANPSICQIDGTVSPRSVSGTITIS
jgi:hypothetical protein